MSIPNVAVKTIEEIQSDILKKKKKIATLRGEISDLETSLKAICDHRDAGPYYWEHDNGYGRQTKMIGKQCKYCHMIDLWNNNHFVNSSDIHFSDFGGYQ